jgi:hypothetical protein
MTAKHTPGPWVFEADEDKGVIRLKMGTALDENACSWKAQHLIELEFDPDARESWEEAVANMRLMSAAPDLLAAAEAALEYMSTRKGGWHHPLYSLLEAAIAKAKGGEQQ